MTTGQIFTVWASLLGIVLFCTSPACANPTSSVVESATFVYRPRQRTREDVAIALKQMAQADVVYLAETHDRASDHQAQLEIIQSLHQLRPTIAIAMEMFQRPYQSVLNRYLSGQLTEADLQAYSQYHKRWGYSWEFYAPMLRFAKANDLAVIALNTPSEVTRKVARTGLNSLNMAERQWIPPKSAIVLGPTSYRQRLRQVYDTSHQGKSNSMNFERFFQAQVLWDETMAEQIVKTLQQQPNRLVIVLVGQGHIHRDGIPSRVARRINSRHPRSRPLKQISVMLNPPMEEPIPEHEIADFFWHSP